MQNRKIIILIILGIVAVASLIYGIVTPSSIRRDVMSKSETTSVSPAEPTARNIPLYAERSAKRSTYAAWGRNPFVPVVAVLDIAPDLVLTGIFWDEARPSAIINKEIVFAGDTVSGAVVVTIRKRSVKLNDGIKDIELTLEE